MQFESSSLRGVCTDVINVCDVLDLWRERRAADMHEASAMREGQAGSL